MGDTNQDQNLKSDTQTVHYKAVTRGVGSQKGKYFAAVFLLLAACFMAGLGGGYVANELNLTPAISDRNSAHDGNAVISKDEADISAVATKVGPSVVSVLTRGQTQTFFGVQNQSGAGTGIILSSDGYILTNKHVIEGSRELVIVTSDGTVYDDVEVVGADPLNDIAFLKVNGVKDLQPATLGDSSSVRIGQNVVAIGNSLGEFHNTVTSGIISGTGRPIAAIAEEGDDPETLTDLIQTDAAINHGNSGGPLTNLSGQVIGINTAIAEDAQSIGFAIPINSAKGIIEHLLKTGKVQRAYLGINYVMITPEMAKKENLSVKKGALITSDQGQSVISGSPAEKAGLKDGDIIAKVGDLEVGDRGSVASLISEYSVGERVQLDVIRDGKPMTVTVELQVYTAP